MVTDATSVELGDHFFRREYGRLVALLTARFGAHRLESIEDAAQTALMRAVATWPRQGVPRAPAAWLTTVARRCLIDTLRREGRELPPPSDEDLEPDAQAHLGGEFRHHEIRMLFVCCDGALDPRARLVMALRFICGLGVREIATRLFVSEANAHKLLSRGRARLRERWGDDASLGDPPAHTWAARLPEVQRVIYLLFNEGYSSQRDDEPIRPDLCEDALRMTHMLIEEPAGDHPSSWALLALMLFHAARLDARTDEAGGLLLLDEQDRSRWDQGMLLAGFRALARSASGDDFSRFHAEAAVLAEHVRAPTYAETNWAEIVELYALMEQRWPSPLYRLNRAIALAELEGPHAGLRVLEEDPPPGWLAGYYLYLATVGELARRSGDFERARRHLQQAMEGAPTAAERRIFKQRLARCPPEG